MWAVNIRWATRLTLRAPEAVSGHYSPTQKAIYDAVEIARQAAIQKCRPGIEYKQVHFEAVRSLTQSLKVLGLLKGSLEELLSAEVVSYFFPHGVGHLLGLDVHDMEDLGDLAGYGADRIRDFRREPIDIFDLICPWNPIWW